MPAKILLTLLFFSSYISLFSQIIISGKLTENHTHSPIAFANVFIADTEIGTVSDEEGNYSLNIPTPGQAEIVISHIGYEPIAHILLVPDIQELELNWSLTPRETETVEVDIESKRSRTWKRRLNQFLKSFIGESPFAGKCELLNPEVLRFTEKNGVLAVESAELLEIENSATGFKILFSLEGFKKEGKLISYYGKPFFQPMIPRDDKEAKSWAKNREIAYLGSPMHFYRSLVENKVEEEGFEIFQVKSSVNGKEFERIKKLSLEALPESDSQSWKIQVPGTLEIVYEGETDWRIKGTNGSASSSQSPGGNPAGIRGSSAPTSQVSWLQVRNKQLLVDPFGYLLEQRFTHEYGFWAAEKIAELLPRTFEIEETFQDEEQIKGPRKNGFLLSPSLIGAGNIQPGGPPRDGIASIDRPRFVLAEKEKFMKEEDWVIGITRNGIARAYPVFILERHEVVNDRFGEEKVLITYCPLCGSGMAFLKDSSHVQTTFGVSGLLYNSNLLLYDRETESLWSQVMGKAIAGPRMGDSLKTIPIVFTTWKRWKTLYPATEVLRKPINSLLDYRENPYRGYEDEQRLNFKVNETSRKLPNKTRVLGVKVGSETIAYSYPALKKEKFVESEFNGVRFELHYDEMSGSVTLNSAHSNQIEYEHVYWFAWYAFYPETWIWDGKVRRAKKK